MSVPEISKVRLDLAQLLEENYKIADEAIGEFAKKKGMEVSSLDRLMSKGNGMLILELIVLLMNMAQEFKIRRFQRRLSSNDEMPMGSP